MGSHRDSRESERSTSTRRSLSERALVIGAGPSGLVAAKYLLESVNPRYDVTILEEQTQQKRQRGEHDPPSSSSDQRYIGGIGGTFVNKVYDGTRLVSSKYITAFSDFRMTRQNPEGGCISESSGKDHTSNSGNCRTFDASSDSMDVKSRTKEAESCADAGAVDCYPIEHTNHPSADDYVKYLEAYSHRFNITRCIKFGCKVISLQAKTNDGSDEVDLDSDGYMVQYELIDSVENKEPAIINEHYDVVAVCSGLHNVPTIPDSIASIRRSFHGKIIHSSQYKDPSIFDGKRVLVLGSGETAMDIALRAIQNESSKTVALNVRRGFLSIPHNLAEDRPLDVFITNLFEHSYEHPWVQALRLRWILSTIVIRFFLFLTGSSVGFNQWACETTPIRRGYHIINKSHGAMSHLNVPIKSKTLWGRLWMRIYGEVGLRPITSFHRTSMVDIQEDGKTVVFDDGRVYEADVIILATGYMQSFPFLDNAIREEHQREARKNVASAPSSFLLKEDYLPAEHFITSKRRPRLSFIGFVRPNVGAIPPMSELQVMWWLCRMRGKVNMLESGSGVLPSYMVLGSKYPYGVDYGNYMHRVAEDIGAAPTISCLAMNSSKPLKALFTYCMGQSHIPLFRLQGPFECRICWDVVVGELWDVCVKRGLAENFGLVAVCLMSLWMNLAACVLEIMWCLITVRRPKFFTRY